MKFFLTGLFFFLCFPLLGHSFFEFSFFQENSIADFHHLLDQESDLRVQGDKHLFAGEYEEALLHYEKALEIVPYKFETLYNTACALARLDRPEQAMYYLQKSVLIHEYALDLALDDRDLESIWEREDFQSLINRLKSR